MELWKDFNMGIDISLVSDLDCPFGDGRLLYVRIVRIDPAHYVKNEDDHYEINILTQHEWYFLGGLIEIDLRKSIAPVHRIK